MAAGIAELIGGIPYRLALAGGWIDQPFVSALNPSPPGSMVVVSVEPDFPFMDFCGMATSTRKIAHRIWKGALPDRPPEELVRELYAEENRGKADPSGSQDMVGLVYPGISRIDYDASVHGGIFPAKVESSVDASVAGWLERVIRVLPVAQRPSGYSPLIEKNLEPGWIARLGETGKACYASILARDLRGLQASMDECMACWAAILPGTVRHPALRPDLEAILGRYQAVYGGAMYSGCGGGYLYIATEAEVPGSFGVRVRLPTKRGA
jgi:hypothetical protein